MLLSYLYRAGRGLAVAALSLVATASIAAQSAKEGTPAAELQVWIARMDAHVPGELDAAAKAHASLSPSSRSRLLKLAGPFASHLRGMNEIGPGRARLSESETAAITVLAAQVSARDTFADWLLKAVMFETDVAILAPELTAVAMQDARGADLPETIHAEDGEVGSRSFLNWHFQLARELLDRREPLKGDAVAASWYHAVALYQLEQSLLGELRPHLEKALPMFHEDSRIHFDLGCLKDALGSARVQAVLIGVQPIGLRPSVPTEASAESQAIAHFSRAVDLDAKAAEPRVRLARLLEKAGKAKEALTLLAQASPLLQSRELAYMTYLIAARSNGALGQIEDARLHIKAALQLFPTAQSPLVALSQLALEAGDLDAAVEAASQLRANPNREDRVDPWWSYFRAPWLRHSQLLDDLRAQLRR